MSNVADYDEPVPTEKEFELWEKLQFAKVLESYRNRCDYIPSLLRVRELLTKKECHD